MGKRYSRNRSYHRNSVPNPIFLLIFAVCVFLYNYWKILLTLVLIAGAFLLVYFVIRRKSQLTSTPQHSSPSLPADPIQEPAKSPSTYSLKNSIMTECEKSFFEVIKEIVEPQYTIQPQINLASVIDKEQHSKYRNELFRNIDFGIFDKNYSLVLLIEINDQSHTQPNRIDRDNKVKSICADAGIPLITFWTKYGIDKKYIYNRLQEYLPLIAASQIPIK